jgi:hypothetical protein
MANWFKRISDAVYREYDRRIKRASLITEYGIDHSGHDSATTEDESDIEIVNVPRGARINVSDDNDEGEIVNLPRGTVVAAPEPPPVEQTLTHKPDE